MRAPSRAPAFTLERMPQQQTPSGLHVSPRLYALAARVRGLSQRLGVPLFFGGLAAAALGAQEALGRGLLAAIVLVGVAALMLSMGLVFARLEAPLAPRVIAAPVRGRWMVINSPASRVPSHGTNGYGQTYGFDLLHDPPGDERPSPRGLGFDPPERFPAFGQPVLAPADGVVVASRSTGRDHRCRARWPAFAVLFLEGFLRELLGVRFVVGNYVVLDIGDGAYAMCGHLQRRSVAVARGQRVRAGEIVGLCGNSGNSSEPHVHLQVMDHLKPLYAAGLPVKLPASVTADRPSGVPVNGEHLDADAQPQRAAPTRGDSADAGVV